MKYNTTLILFALFFILTMGSIAATNDSPTHKYESLRNKKIGNTIYKLTGRKPAVLPTK